MDLAHASGQSTSVSQSLRQWVQQHQLFSYFFLAYAISWVLFIPYVLAEWGILSGDHRLFYILHTFGPAFAAIIVTAVIAGKSGSHELRMRIRQRKTSWQWYLFILVVIPMLVLLGIVIQPGAVAGFHDLT